MLVIGRNVSTKTTSRRVPNQRISLRRRRSRERKLPVSSLTRPGPVTPAVIALTPTLTPSPAHRRKGVKQRRSRSAANGPATTALLAAMNPSLSQRTAPAVQTASLARATRRRRKPKPKPGKQNARNRSRGSLKPSSSSWRRPGQLKIGPDRCGAEGC